MIVPIFNLISFVASRETSFSLTKLIYQAKYYIPGKVVQYQFMIMIFDGMIL